jgi:hypothetical protein
VATAVARLLALPSPRLHQWRGVRRRPARRAVAGFAARRLSVLWRPEEGSAVSVAGGAQRKLMRLGASGELLGGKCKGEDEKRGRRLTHLQLVRHWFVARVAGRCVGCGGLCGAAVPRLLALPSPRLRRRWEVRCRPARRLSVCVRGSDASCHGGGSSSESPQSPRQWPCCVGGRGGAAGWGVN